MVGGHDEAPAAADPDPGRVEDSPRTSLARRTLAALVLLTALVAAQQVVWAFTERPGVTVDVDEGAYFTRAVDASHRLHARQPGSLVSLYFSEDHPEAPLLSVVTAPMLLVGSPRIAWGLVAQVAVLCLLIVATFFVGRRLVGDPWSLLAAMAVAAAPGFIDYTRSYQFALLSAAMLMTAVWCLLASERFTRGLPAIGWGLFVGLALLSRSMMVALVPGLVAAAALAAVVPLGAAASERGRRISWFAAGSAVAALVALPWWVANWTAVSAYLTSYGYGGSGSDYGQLYSPTEPLYYARIPYRMAQELYLPLALVLAVGLVLAAWSAAVIWRRVGGRNFVIRTVETGHLLVVVTLGAGVLALMSSRNKGTGFVLPLLPLVVVLAVLGLSRVRLRAVRWAGAGVLIAVLLFNVVMKSGFVSLPDGEQTVAVSDAEGPLPVVDGRSKIEVYLGFGAYPADTDLSPVVSALLNEVADESAGGDVPVVAVTEGDYLLNANLVALALLHDIEQRRGVVWAVAAPVEGTVGGYADVLEASAGNPPTTFLVTVDSGPITYPGAADIATVEEAARQSGFTPRRTVPLEDGRDIRLWQREVPTGS